MTSCVYKGQQVPMEFVNLPKSSRQSALSELTRLFPGCKSPFEALLMYCGYLRDAFPDRALMVLSTSGLPAGQYRVWRLMLDDGAEQVELHDPWQDTDLPIYSGGVIGGMMEAGSPRLGRDIDW